MTTSIFVACAPRNHDEGNYGFKISFCTRQFNNSAV
jgi:hypothetical protein